MPLAKIEIGPIEDLLVRDGLVDDAPEAIRSGLGCDGERSLAALPQQPDDRLGQIVHAERRRADRIAHPGEPRQDAFDLGVVAERDRHQPGAGGVRPRRGGKLEDAIGGERPDRQIVVSGPAEPAQVGASAHDLDEEPRSELGVGREDAGVRRVEVIGALDRRLPDGSRRTGAGLRLHRGEAPVFGVLHVVERGDVEPRPSRERGEDIEAGAGRLERAHEIRDQRFAFTGGDDVGERRERFGVHEGDRTADDDQGMPSRPLAGIVRQSGQAQHRHDVRIVPLERHRERQDIELVERRLRFDRDEARPARQHVLRLGLRRQEHPLAHHLVEVVEQPVHRLEAEVGHPDVVGVRKRQGYPQARPARLDDVANLPGEG